LHNDFTRQRCDRVLIAKNRALDFAAANRFLNDDFVVVAKGVCDRAAEMIPVGDLADSNL
jgi:hypothetical protein